MYIINTLSDLQHLQDTKSLPNPLTDLLEMELRNLHEALGNDELIETFSLTTHGPLIFLSGSENDLTQVGLTEGLITHCVEYAELFNLPDGINLWIVGIFFDNDYLSQFFAIVGTQPQSVETWLSEQAD